MLALSHTRYAMQWGRSVPEMILNDNSPLKHNTPENIFYFLRFYSLCEKVVGAIKIYIAENIQQSMYTLKLVTSSYFQSENKSICF